MRRRRLGEGGPEVSIVGLGTNNFGRRTDYDQSLAVIDAALDAGITLFDTADIYGESEEYIGRALEGRRDRVVLATKFGKPLDGAPGIPRGSREYIRWAVERSLRRLRTDVIDVYQMHEPDDRTPIEETLGALHELVQEGKVRHLGSSNFSAQQIEEADRVARERGLLTGKYTNGVEATEGRLAGREIPEGRWSRLEGLQRFAEERGVPLLAVAIGGLLAMPSIASVIAGATKPEQVRANVAAGEWEPSAEDLEVLKRLR